MVDCWRAQFISGYNLFLTFSTPSIIAFQLDFDRLRGTNLPEPSYLQTSTTLTVHSAPCLCLQHKCPSFFRLEMELLTAPQLVQSYELLQRMIMPFLHSGLWQTWNCLSWFSPSISLLCHCPTKPSGTPKNLQNHWIHRGDVELWSP